MTEITPEAALSAIRWTAKSMEQRENWKFTAPATLSEDAYALSQWAATVADPLASLGRETLDLPSVRALAAQIAWELDNGTGVAWVRQVPPLDEQTMRLLYLALGLQLGTPIETYGRLYDVTDSGASYKDKPIPVSQTRESTGMHTDSSVQGVCPRVIGLLCIRPAPRGGNSRIVSAAETHEQLRTASPALLERLYRSYVRDVVTPGAERSQQAVAQNRFPVFAWQERRLLFRYMRYWIERGYDRAGLSLELEDTAAFDILDQELSAERNVLTFRMEPGEMLFIDNTTIAHDRDAYEDDPAAPRLLVRLWLERSLPS